MSGLCTSKTHFSSLLISYLVQFCSIILSHPLYFSYFIFFSPYLLKLVSFLSPLFITTFLLFLALLTGLVHDNFSNVLAQTRVSHLLVACRSVLERLQPKKDDGSEDFYGLEDLEMYRVVFGSSVMEVKGNQVDVLEEKSEANPLQASESGVLEGSSHEDLSTSKCEAFMCNEVVGNAVHMEQKRLENFLKILDQFERMTSNVEEKKVEPPLGAKVEKVIEKQKAESLVRYGSEATGYKVNFTTTVSVKSTHAGKEYSSKVKEHSQKLGSDVDPADENGRGSTLKAESSPTLDHNLGTYGSMRKEKEWKRTLACKLFEERHNVEGGEGMDSLWEAYENDSMKSKPENDKNKKNKKKKEDEFDEESGNEEEEEEEIDGQLCCLQALKLSSGKMNLGIGRPNLVRISKAIKGIGWMHHVRKHSKKVHNNGDRH